MLNAFGIANYFLILIFGLLLSLMFAGIENTPKNRKVILFAILILFSVQFIFWLFLGYRTSAKIYPFLIHIPNIIFITSYFKRSKTIAFVSVLCAYLCCQFPKWFATLALNVFEHRMAYFIVYTLAILPMFYLLKRYVVLSVNRLMNISKRSLLLFSFVPLLYYIFDYATTTYTNILYQSSEVAVIFMPSMVSLLYFVFIMFYYNELQHRNNAENENILLSVQIKQSKKELDTFWQSQERDAIYRHDMRHHLNLIGGFLADGNAQKAIEYITRAKLNIEQFTPILYCENSIASIILSHFATKAKEHDILFSCEVEIPQTIGLAETELCALLSNSLENAIKACTEISDAKHRKIHITSNIHKNSLLIHIENSYNGDIITENDLHVSNYQGHGFGVKSMVMIINKYNGCYSYTLDKDMVTLRIELPLP